MNIHEINAKVSEMLAAVEAKPGFKIQHIPSFDGDRIEIRDANGSLMFRGYAFETDFLFELNKALEYYAVAKTTEEIAAEKAQSRAAQLRLEAVLFEQRGFDDFATWQSNFTREEIENEIAAMNAEIDAGSAVASANSDTLAAVKRYILTASDMMFNGATVTDAVVYVSGMCEGLERSPFELDGFAKALAHAFQTPNAVQQLCDALQFTDDAWVIDLRRVEVKTNGGMTLIAPAWSVRTYAGLERLAAYWDMRLGLTRNEQYFLTVKGADIKEVHYV